MHVKCKLVENEPCIKCGSLQPTMAKVGAFTMCLNCWYKEFGQAEIPVNSEQYNNYVLWLNETEFGKNNK